MCFAFQSGGPGSHGNAYHPLPRADQHFQHRDDQLPQRGGHDGHWRLDAGLHLLCVRSSVRLRIPSVEEEEELFEKKEKSKTNGGGGQIAGNPKRRLQVNVIQNIHQKEDVKIIY